MLATVVCVLALTGCVSYRASKYTAMTGAAALVSGIVVAAVEPNTGETDGHALTNLEAAATGLILIGGLTALAGVFGMAAHRPSVSR